VTSRSVEAAQVWYLKYQILVTDNLINTLHRETKSGMFTSSFTPQYHFENNRG